MRRALLLAASLALAGCDAPAGPGGSAPARLDQVGTIRWDCREADPWIELRADVGLDPYYWRHEMIHVVQAKRYGCRRWNLGFTALELAELEREAHCGAARTVWGEFPPECEVGQVRA